MKLRTIQNQVGKFNMLGGEESLAFSYAIVDNDNKIIERDGIQCRIVVKETDDPERAQSYLTDYTENGDIDEILLMSAESTKGYISSTDYAGEREAFIEQYIESFDGLREQFVSSKRTALEAEIKRLKEKLQTIKLPDARYEAADYFKQEAAKHTADAERFRGWAKEYKKSTDKYKSWTDRAVEAEKLADTLNAKYEMHMKALESEAEK